MLADRVAGLDVHIEDPDPGGGLPASPLAPPVSPRGLSWQG
jgi:hypothetical protein